MTTQAAVPVRRRAAASTSRLWQRRPRWLRHTQAMTGVGLLLAIVLVALGLENWDTTPRGLFYFIVVTAGLFLGTTWLASLDLVIIVVYVWFGITRWYAEDTFIWPFTVLLSMMVLMYWLSSSRSRLGVQGTLGESMLVDLRDRLRTQGEMPELPVGWNAEICIRSAYGASFSGDFVVASRSGGEDQLEVVIVDVSGKGVDAGTRSLLLSGAFGGLLGALDSDQFLPAANSYLIRQDWQEGFATAAHATVDFATGDFSVGSAGHPPPVQFHAGSGRWVVLDGHGGPLLGVMEGLDFPRYRGLLRPGDALLLYTDGVIETRNRDLGDGIDRMLGVAERSMPKGFAGIAERICASAMGGASDDRAAVIIWRPSS